MLFKGSWTSGGQDSAQVLACVLLCVPCLRAASVRRPAWRPGIARAASRTRKLLEGSNCRWPVIQSLAYHCVRLREHCGCFRLSACSAVRSHGTARWSPSGSSVEAHACSGALGEKGRCGPLEAFHNELDPWLAWFCLNRGGSAKLHLPVARLCASIPKTADDGASAELMH